jgi:hypothetical protein
VLSRIDTGDYPAFAAATAEEANLFRYCHNDPVDFTDPMGTQDVEREPWPNHQEQAKALSATEAVWERQMNFSSSFGAISHGMAAYAYQQLQNAVHDVQIGGKTYQQSSNREKLVNVMAERAHDRLEQERANPRVGEVSTYVSQRNNGSYDYLGHPLTLQNRRTDGLEGSILFNKNRGERDPSPTGYHVVAGIVAQRVFRERMSFRDQAAFRGLGYDGYTVVPGNYLNPHPFYIRPYHYPDEPQ